MTSLLDEDPTSLDVATAPSDTIRAARIAADAAVHAAWVQSIAGVVTGGLALIAAAIVGWAAYRSAIRQVRLQESQAESRIKAYRDRMSIILNNLDESARFDRAEAEVLLRRYRSGCTSGRLQTVRFEIPGEVAATAWERHAMLGIEVVRSLHGLRSTLREAVRFNKEMNAATVTAVSEFPTVDRIEEASDGGILLHQDVCVVQHFKVADELVSAIAVVGDARDRAGGKDRAQSKKPRAKSR